MEKNKECVDICTKGGEHDESLETESLLYLFVGELSKHKKSVSIINLAITNTTLNLIQKSCARYVGEDLVGEYHYF